MNRWAVPIATAAALAALVACTGADSPGGSSAPATTAADSSSLPTESTPSGTSIRPTEWTPTTRPSASCPVTVGSARTVPPSPIDPTDNPAALPGSWYGNTALWTRLAPRGVLPGQRWESDSIGTKFPWWRLVRGARLTISAQRLDGPSAGFRSDIPDGNGDFGFQPTSLIWPSPGCWRVTGTLAGQSLSFVAWVVRAAE
jgi:hypothetical protein